MDGIPVLLRILQDIAGVAETDSTPVIQPAMDFIANFTREPPAKAVLGAIEAIAACHEVDNKYVVWGSMWSKFDHGMQAAPSDGDIYSAKLLPRTTQSNAS